MFVALAVESGTIRTYGFAPSISAVIATRPAERTMKPFENSPPLSSPSATSAVPSDDRPMTCVMCAASRRPPSSR